MYTPLNQVQTFEYVDFDGQKHPVLFVLDPAKKGYINATAIAKQFDKKPHDWLKYQPVQEYINALIKMINSRNDYNRNGTKTVCYDDLIITIQGGSPELQGTWLHPKLAVFFARWLAPHFAVWCDELIAELLNQYPTQQRQFSELRPVLNQLFEQLADVKASQKQMEQRFEQNINTVAQMLNHWQAQFAQDNKYALGQIFNGINQLNKVLGRQQQADLFKPPVEVTIKQTLLDYQHSLEQTLQQMLRGQQDDLIQNYLLAIKDNLEQIVQRLATESAATQSVTPPVTQSVTQPAIITTALATEIAAFREQEWTWQRIAQELNARGTATASGKGQWHGSSVKRYLESHAAR